MAVLVAAGHSEGASRTVVDTVAESLSERKIDVTVGGPDDLSRAGEFDAVVFGSETEGELWPADVKDAFEQATDTLNQKPVWLFFVGESDPGGVSIAPRGRRKFAAEPDRDDVRSWASLIADELDGHS